MAADILQFILYAAILVALAWPLGDYMARVYQGERTLLTPVLAPVAQRKGPPAGKIRRFWLPGRTSAATFWATAPVSRAAGCIMSRLVRRAAAVGRTRWDRR